MASDEVSRQADRLAAALQRRADVVEAQLDRLQNDIVESYRNLTLEELRNQRDAVQDAVTSRKHVLRDATTVTVRSPRLVGRVHVLAGGGTGDQQGDSDSEARSMLACARLLEAEGFHVTDVHQEGCGYDLRARRDYEQRCVEVKGLANDIGPGIMLESSEWLMAQQLRDEYWVYIWVECASTPRLFGAYRNPVALFTDSKRLVQRFHIPGAVLRKVLAS